MSVARLIAAAATVALIAPLGACSGGMSGIRSTLGITKEAPDEFGVVSRAPLSLPPDYTLRPPQTGALRPQDTTPTEVARQTVFRVPTDKAAGPTAVAPAPTANGANAQSKEGRLVIFPAWLKHTVPANDGQTERISISFNLMFKNFTEEMAAPLWDATAGKEK